MKTNLACRLLARTSRARRIRRLSLYGPLGILGILLGGCGGSSPFTLPSMPSSMVEKNVPTAAQVLTDSSSLPDGVTAEEGVYFQAARAYEIQGDLEEAVKHYELAVQHAPGNTRVLVAYARMLDRHERFDDAERKYREALRWDANSPNIHNDLGLCQARAGRLTDSLESLDQATRLSPNEARYRNNIAKVLVEVGRFEDALRHLEEVHPPAVAHHNLGYFLQGKQEINLATRHFAQAMELDPTLARQDLIKSSARDPSTSAVAATQWDSRSRAYAAPRWEAPGRNVHAVAARKIAPATPRLASQPPSQRLNPDSSGVSQVESSREFERPASYSADAQSQGPVLRRLPTTDATTDMDGAPARRDR